MIKISKIQKSNKEKDVIILYNTITITSKQSDFNLLISSQIDITSIDPKHHGLIFNIINKAYNKNITLNLVSQQPQVKKNWWNTWLSK
jgi:hypothetical protein